MQWWFLDFFLSSFIFLLLAPPLGHWIRRKHNCLSVENSSLDFILGFTAVSLLASFLLPFHQLGIPVLILSLLYFRFKYSRMIKFYWSDLVIVIPIVVVMYLLPVTLDSNFREYQFSIDHDFWPLDYRNRLDSHFGLSGLLSYFHPKVPIMNILSTQVPMLSLLCWRIIFLSLRLILGRVPKVRETVLTVSLFMSTLFYRKQIFGKASPIGACLLLLICAFLTCDLEFGVSELVFGWLMACTFIFGEYGFILLIPLLIILCLGAHRKKDFIVKSLPYAFLFMIPEMVRKLYITQTPYLLVVVMISIIAAYVIKKYSSVIVKSLPTFRNFEKNFLFFVLSFSILMSLIPISWVPSWNSKPYLLMTFYHWTVKTSGLLMIFIFWRIAITNRSEKLKPFLALLSVQFMIFVAVHFASLSHFDYNFNPNMIWWNLHKNAVMIIFPLLTTLLGSIFLIDCVTTQNKSNGFKAFTFTLLIALIIFLQDPLVKSDPNGPLSPYAPRLSTLQSLKDMFWEAQHSKGVFSEDGNLILWPPLALKEPDLIERVRIIQARFIKPIHVCIDSNLWDKRISDFDFKTYSIEFPTGAIADFDDSPLCAFKIVSFQGICPRNQKLIFKGTMAILCGLPDL
jgi:hypothetical protein